MEIFLLSVTAVSLLIALVMSAAAWRLSREDRARTAARVAALAAAAADAHDTAVAPELTRAAAAAKPMAVAVPAPSQDSMVAESDALVTAPRIAEPRAPWAPSRVTAFAPPSRPAPIAAQATMRAADLTLNADESSELPLRLEPVRPAAPSMTDGFLGGQATAPVSGGGQRGLAFAAAILFVIVFGAGYFVVFGDRTTGSASATAAASDSPLELVSLRHERQGGRLAVSGLVRNPIAGHNVERLAAVVFLFDQQGGFLTSAKTNVDFTRLSPGDESPFVISMDAPSSVARYRVSFRTDSGVVPHIDRRGQEPVAPNAIGTVSVR